jgi:hypothetical protein
MAIMTVEQFEQFAKSLPEGTDQRKVARAMGVELPVEIKPISEQLAGVSIVKHTPKATKNNATPAEKVYVSVPSLKLDQAEGTRSFWVSTKVARQVAEQIIRTLDANNL